MSCTVVHCRVIIFQIEEWFPVYTDGAPTTELLGVTTSMYPKRRKFGCRPSDNYLIFETSITLQDGYHQSLDSFAWSYGRDGLDYANFVAKNPNDKIFWRCHRCIIENYPVGLRYINVKSIRFNVDVEIDGRYFTLKYGVPVPPPVFSPEKLVSLHDFLDLGANVFRCRSSDQSRRTTLDYDYLVRDSMFENIVGKVLMNVSKQTFPPFVNDYDLETLSVYDSYSIGPLRVFLSL